MSETALERLRAICLALPESVETGGVGDPVFKVRGKIFAMRHPADGRESMWCKAAHGLQAAIVESDPEHCFVPPYVGRHGWIGVWLDREVDWVHAAGLIHDSYRMTAGKRLVALMDGNRSA